MRRATASTVFEAKADRLYVRTMDSTIVLSFTVLAVIVIWFIMRPSKPQNIKIKQLGKPDLPVQYNVHNLNIPRISGVAMLFVKWLAKTSAKYILGPRSIRKSNLDIFRTMDIPDCPTIIPLPLPSWNPPSIPEQMIEFDKYLKPTRCHKNLFSFVSIADLTNAYRQQKITPLDVANNVIRCIENSDKRNPKMRAFTQYNTQEILKMAKESTERYQKGKLLSFLDGVPVGIKEEYDVVPYYLYNGTTFWTNETCQEDSSVVKKLRDGGAMIVGMTNMHEIGIGVTGNNCNRLHGTPRNPYNVNYYTGGSSSGSAAAVASGLCLVGLGTDGGGSIRMPAAACGVVGIKASFGRINKAGVVHICHTVSHTGPICNNVTDAALVYGYIAGKDEQDFCTMTQPPVTLHGFNQTASLDGIKLGIDWDFFKHTDTEVYEECRKVLQSLEQIGCQIVPIQIPELEETRVAHGITIMSEMSTGMVNYFERCYSELNTDSVLSLGLGKQFTAMDYIQAQKQRTRAMIFLEEIFQDVDCIVTPALGIKVPVIRDDAIKYGEANPDVLGKMMRFMSLGNLTGIPGMTLPIGYDDNGLPISLQIMSGWWQEHVMLRVAKATEGLIDRRQPEVYYNILE